MKRDLQHCYLPTNMTAVIGKFMELRVIISSARSLWWMLRFHVLLPIPFTFQRHLGENVMFHRRNYHRNVVLWYGTITIIPDHLIMEESRARYVLQLVDITLILTALRRALGMKIFTINVDGFGDVRAVTDIDRLERHENIFNECTVRFFCCNAKWQLHMKQFWFLAHKISNSLLGTIISCYLMQSFAHALLLWNNFCTMFNLKLAGINIDEGMCMKVQGRERFFNYAKA